MSAPPLLSGSRVRIRNRRASDTEWIERELLLPDAAPYWSRENLVTNPAEGRHLQQASIECVIERLSDDEPVGIVRAYALEGVDQHCRIGIAAVPSVRGVGWTSEAIGLLADLVFASLAMNKIYFEFAERSAGASARIGKWLPLEGVYRDRSYQDGVYQDVYIYAMYRTFWETTLRPALETVIERRERARARRAYRSEVPT